MRTPPLLRLALLLATAQYAEGAAAGCAAAPKPLVACPTIADAALSTAVDCKSHPLDGTGCATGYTAFVELPDGWAPATAVACENDKWIATVEGEKEELKPADTVVCAKLSPDTKKCGLCANVAPHTMCVPPGCTPGANPVESTSAGGCKELACPGTEHFSLNKNAKQLVASKKITCTEQKKWTDGAADVTTAVCAKDTAGGGTIQCPAVSTLADCGNANPAAGCVVPTVSATDVLTCAGPSPKLFIGSGGVWKEGTGKCDKTRGKWMLDGPTPTEITKAVCAKQNPSPTGGSSTVPCPTVDALSADCGTISVKPAAACVKPGITNDELNCVASPTSPKLFVDSGTGWKEGAAKCDSTGKWMLVGGTSTVTKALCAKENPTPAGGASSTDVCTTCGAVVAKDCEADKGCVAGGTLVPGVTSDAKQCKTLKCDDGVFITEPMQQGQVDELLCEDDSGAPVWKFMDNVITKASCVKKISCGKIGHLTSDCTGETGFEKCAAIDLNQDDTKLTCTAPSDKMFFKPKNGDWAAETKELKCELFTGIWLRGDDPVSDGDKVICAESQKAASCGTGCAAFTNAAYDCKPDEGCEAGGAAVEDESSGCKIKTCAAGEFFVDGAGKPVGADKIVCNAQDGWETEAATPVAVTAASCVKKFECQKKNPLSSDANVCAGLQNPTDCAAVDLTVAPLACVDPTTNLYVKPAAGGPWVQTADIVCDEKSGEWKRDGSTQALANGDAVVCNKDLPVGKTCPDISSMDVVACQADASIAQDAQATCEVVAISHDNPFKCTTSTNTLYIQTDRSKMWKKVEGELQCDKDSNSWKDETTALVGVKKVICVSKEPNHKHTCPLLPTGDCASVDAALDCSAVAFPPVAEVGRDYNNAMCTDGKTLYFKPKGKQYFQEWYSIKCLANGTWQLTIPPTPVGTQNANTQIGGNEDNYICAKSNPDPAVCTRVKQIKDIKEFDFPKDVKKYEVGHRFECGVDDGDKLDEFVSAKGILELSKDLLCHQDGKWKLGDVDYGAVACGLRKCRQCDAVPPEGAYTLAGAGTTKLPDADSRSRSPCLELACAGSNDAKFAVKIDDDPEFFNLNGKVTCVEKLITGASSWTITSLTGDRVGVMDLKEANCVQKFYCLSSGTTNPPPFKQVRVDCPPSIDVPGCVSPTSSGASGGVPDNTLTCPTGKKLLIGPLNATNNDVTDYWEEVIGSENTPEKIKCDVDIGKWNVILVDENNAKEQRDYRHRIVCGDSNPRKKTTTTTTTTTPPPPEKICDLCKKALPKTNLTKENMESMATFNPDSTEGDGKECVMKAAEGYQLLIGDNNNVVTELICTRDKPNEWYVRKCEGEGDKKACNATGAAVGQFTSKKLGKDETWKPLTYIVITVTLLLIGGMGIGCFMIYFRMRKDLSEKEKKKERGVTKKYTAANVMKTSGKSSGAQSEMGKSKEPTKSKMEENEDAPTLKL